MRSLKGKSSSCGSNQPAPPKAVVFGEIGLSGEIRPVGQTDLRLKEAAKLGFGEALLPQRPRPRSGGDATTTNMISLTEIRHLRDLVALISAPPAGDINRPAGRKVETL